MQITVMDGFVAQASAKGVTREVSLFLLQDEMPVVGDYVMVHVGYAIQTMSAAEAQSAWELYDEMLTIESDMHRA
jgi:hydrogenase expression/formation protein HypC